MKYFGLILPILFLLSCEDEKPIEIKQRDWTIDTDYLRYGCLSGKDCIPSLQEPNKSHVEGDHLEFLNDNDLVVGLWNGSQYIAYPHAILDWHEIVNESGYTISYCPLTGSALHIETTGEFGVSGMLFNTNLIMYDRDTESHWPQMLLTSAEGSRQGEELALKTMIETKWSTWKKLFPNSIVVNSQTGHSRDYNVYPYGGYRSCNSSSCGDYIYFPVPPVDTRLPAKTRVLSIITDNIQIAYPIDQFDQPTILNETIDGATYAIILSANDNLAVAFEASSTLSISQWDPENGTIFLMDSNGNQYNILGRSINAASDDLVAAKSFISYWFSQAAFYPDTEIHS
ncbi:MAG: DUF3179 domain-containing (seleno)protein [Fidelibacterota bacterium]